jgi:hypothetical protein
MTVNHEAGLTKHVLRGAALAQTGEQALHLAFPCGNAQMQQQAVPDGSYVL